MSICFLNNRNANTFLNQMCVLLKLESIKVTPFWSDFKLPKAGLQNSNKLNDYIVRRAKVNVYVY